MRESRLCSTCRFCGDLLPFCDGDEDILIGICRRFPPVHPAVLGHSETPVWGFPIVQSDQFCGEWRRKTRSSLSILGSI